MRQVDLWLSTHPNTNWKNEMQDDAGIGLDVHAIFDRISDKLPCNRHFLFSLFYFFAGVQPFQDAYGTKLATALMFQRHLVLRALCGRVGGQTEHGLVPTKYFNT